MIVRRLRALGATVLLVGTTALTFATEPGSAPSPYVPRKLATPAISLEQAIALTLQSNPSVLSEQQVLQFSVGRLQEAKGLFDQIARLGASFADKRHQNFPFITSREKTKRDTLRALAMSYAIESHAFLTALASPQSASALCPDDLDLDLPNIQEGLDRAGTADTTFEDAFVVRLDGLDGEALDVFDVCVRRSDTGLQDSMIVNNVTGIVNALSSLGGIPDIADVISDIEQRQQERLEFGQNVAEAVATKARLAFQRAGAMPEDEAMKTWAIEGGYDKAFRSGWQFAFDLRLQSSERNFLGKSLDPTFGGMGIRNEFPSLAAVSFDVPLLKGSGKTSADAPEMAAAKSVDAEREMVLHEMTRAAFGTVLAYVRTIGAQEALAALEQSSERQHRIVELVEARVRGGDASTIDRERARARAAVVDGSVAQARQTLFNTRVVLANSIGLVLDDVEDAPQASDQFAADVPQTGTAAELLRDALKNRHDWRGLSFVRDGTAVLRDAAKWDVKPQLDFAIRAGMSTLYESPFNRYLPDELDTPPTDSPVAYDSPSGFWRSVNAPWKPFVTVSLRFELPIKNNVAKGRFAQRDASLRQREIQLRDLERLVTDNVIDADGAIQQVDRAIANRRTAAAEFSRTLEGENARFRGGDLSLIDLLQTEEDLVQQQLELLADVQVRMSLLARLKYESGTLLRLAPGASADGPASFDGSAFVVKRKG